MSDHSTAPVRVEIKAGGTLSYSLAHNEIPFAEAVGMLSELRSYDDALLRVVVRDAEGVLSHPFETQVDIVAGAPSYADVSKIRLDASAMLQVDERRPAEIVATLVHDGVVIGEGRVDVTLLASRQWLADPIPLALELLPAFVMPNDPAVQVLLSEVGERLLRQTGSPSTQGYQSGSERVDQIARAVFEAVQARHVRYSNPPASWADVGQKIRTPSEVLDGRVGTCLDTTVVIAAALEQCGLHTLIFMVSGHAFVGYWTQEASLSSVVSQDGAEVVNQIDLGNIRLIETTMVTERDVPATFESTQRPSYNTYLTGDLTDFLAVVDVRTARDNGIVPLPSRRVTDDGVQVVEYRPTVHSAPPAAARRPSADRPASSGAEVPPRVQQWKNTLLDLSLRNKLINFSERTSIRIAVPDGRLGALEDLANSGSPVVLYPTDRIDDVHGARGIRFGADLPVDALSALLDTKSTVFTDVTSDSYLTRMRNLAHKAKTIVEETGANNLYLALGSLVWDIDGKSLRSPLVLVPVSLRTRARGTTYSLELDESGTSTPNYCLLEKLKQVHGLEIPGLADPALDEYGIDLDAALTATRRAVAERGLAYRVEETADLSILQFAKFRLWKDLDEHWQVLVQNPLVKHLVESPTEPFEDPVDASEAPDLDAMDAACPIPADASQLEAVAAAAAGKTFVLEGPPGTGKSQTITNLLTRAVADGKRVLFVAEKRAALDVVSSRLASVGMGPFALDLHDKGSKPAVVRAQVKQALDHAVTVDEQGLASRSDDLRSARRSLARYADRLHETNPVGISYYGARTNLLAFGEVGDALDVPRTVLSRSPTDLVPVRKALGDLDDTAALARPGRDTPWGFVTIADPTSEQVTRLVELAAAIDDSLDRIGGDPAVAAVVREARDAEQLSALATILRAPSVPLDVLDETRSDRWQQATTGVSAQVAAFVAAAHPGLDVATPAALDLPLGDIHTRALAAASSNFFGRKKRLLAVLDELRPALRPGAEVRPKKLVELTSALLQVQGAMRELASGATGIPGLSVPESWNPLTSAGREVVDEQVRWLSWAGRTVGSSTSTDSSFRSAMRDLLRAAAPIDRAAAESVQGLASATSELTATAGADETTFAEWVGDVGLVGRWAAGVTRRGRDAGAAQSLRRWCAFLAALEPLRQAGLTQAREELRSGRVAAEDALRAFDRGLALASMRERLDATGLDGFDAEVHGRTVRKFTGAVSDVRALMTTAIPKEVLDARPFQAASGRGRVGALQRELQKQRRGLGVRALLETYGDLITQLMPCVLVSPDSVSRFFPVGSQVFDLVVFDEASQIRVADAVGAMGRASAVVVVGDSKQMPPTAFSEASTDAFEDDPSAEVLVEKDGESILDEAILARVPKQWLSWHYRSQDESLIAFSNQHYYEGRLSSFPAPVADSQSATGRGLGVSLVRVDGQFMRSGKGKLLRTNPVEAEAIVADVRRRFDTSSDVFPSVGIVTFNQQQRAHVEALLRDCGDPRLAEALDATDGLFVKNLENVQGDERDVILFSTAFSTNDKGVLPLNFGPLTRGGGERRLNVAVTRARRQVVIYSSFDPQQLRAEETSSVGIKHLRAYLDLAAQGTAALLTSSGRKPVVDRHRDDVADRLRERGLVVRTDVGLSDFKIDLTVADPTDPDEPLVAVLLDGEGWASRRTVGDRDGLPVEVLSKMLRWPAVERVWMPEWLSDRSAVTDRLAGVVQRAKDAPPVAVPAPARAIAREASTDASSAPAPTISTLVASTSPPPAAVLAPVSLPGQELFKPSTPGLEGGREVLDSLPEPWASQAVRSVLMRVIDAEGPVHVDRLARLGAAAFGLNKVNQKRIDQVLGTLGGGVRPAQDPDFAWPSRLDPTTWVSFRVPADGESRPVEQISDRELGNAMSALCQEAAGMTRDELLRETLNVFGGRRLTPGISTRLDAAFHDALRSRLLVVDAHGVVTAGD